MKEIKAKKVAVIGASRGTGRAVVEQLLREGHHVTAFSRKASSLEIESDRLRCIDGDAMVQGDIERAVQGQDAVIVTLGIAENPLGVRFRGARSTASNVRSEGTKRVIVAMKKFGVRRLVVQSSYGVGETRDRLGLIDSLFFALLLKPQIADTEIQEAVVRASGLDWVLAQPVHLSDASVSDGTFVSTEGTTGVMKVSREQVATVLSRALAVREWTGRSVSISSFSA